MRTGLNKIRKDADYKQDGFTNYILDIDVSIPDRTDYDGLLSLCIDARVPVTPIYEKFKSKEPISTAGNALFPEIQSLPNFTNDNVVVTHGIHPSINQSNQPKCGGHIVAFDDDQNDNITYGSLIQNLHPYVKNSFNDYDPYLTTRNLAKIWQAPQARFYDHTTGWLYDVDDLDNKHLGVHPTVFHEGIHPAVGQDPTLIIINTLGKPYFNISRGHKARKLGGVVEIFYPRPELTEPIIESLVYCLQSHYIAKNSKSDQDKHERMQFESSQTILLLAESSEDLVIIAKSILSSKNPNHARYIEGFFRDPNDIVIGLVPEIDDHLFEITAT